MLFHIRYFASEPVVEDSFDYQLDVQGDFALDFVVYPGVLCQGFPVHVFEIFEKLAHGLVQHREDKYDKADCCNHIVFVILVYIIRECAKSAVLSSGHEVFSRKPGSAKNTP